MPPVPRAHPAARICRLVCNRYDFGPAGQAIYAFLWDEYADWYIEISKRRIGASDDPEDAVRARRTLVYVLDSCLRLLHPFMPFVTEELWQRLPHSGDSLMIADWPQLMDAPALPVDADAVAQFQSFQGLVRSIRNVRAEYKVEPGKKIAATILTSGSLGSALEAESDALAFLAKVESSALAFTAEAPREDDGSVRLVVNDGLEALLPLAGMVDFDKERARLGKQQASLAAEVDKIGKRLNAPGFADKAKPEVVEKAKREIAEKTEKLNGVLAALAKLPGGAPVDAAPATPAPAKAEKATKKPKAPKASKQQKKLEELLERVRAADDKVVDGFVVAGSSVLDSLEKLQR